MHLNKCIKVLVLGPAQVGKSTLLQQLEKDSLSSPPKMLLPVILCTFQYQLFRVELSVFDTAAQHEYDKLRRIYYAHTDVVLLVFDVSSPVSFEELQTRFVPEVHECLREPAIIVCGLKADLRRGASALSQRHFDELKTGLSSLLNDSHSYLGRLPPDLRAQVLRVLPLHRGGMVSQSDATEFARKLNATYFEWSSKEEDEQRFVANRRCLLEAITELHLTKAEERPHGCAAM